MGRRIIWIDMAKVFAIMLMLLGHLHIPIEIKNYIYSFHMPLFFLISGVLYKRNKFKAEFRKGVKRLIIPFLLMNLILFVYAVIVGNVPLNIETLKRYSMGLLLTENSKYILAAGATWFFIALFVIKLISSLLLVLSYRMSLFISFVLSVTIVILSHFNIDIWLAVDSALLALPFFIVGYIAKSFVMDTDGSKLVYLIGGVIAMSVLYFLSRWSGRVDTSYCELGKYPIFYYLNSFIGIFGVILICKLFNRCESKFIRTLSDGTILIAGFGDFIAMLLWYHLFIYIYPESMKDNIFVYSLLVLISTCLFYYPTIICKKYFPILMGASK